MSYSCSSPALSLGSEGAQLCYHGFWGVAVKSIVSAKGSLHRPRPVFKKIYFQFILLHCQKPVARIFVVIRASDKKTPGAVAGRSRIDRGPELWLVKRSPHSRHHGASLPRLSAGREQTTGTTHHSLRFITHFLFRTPNDIVFVS